MAKIKFTKGELKRQRDGLKQFRRYLPTLQLKKQQLQMKISEIRRILSHKTAEQESKAEDVGRWAGLLADPWVPKTIVEQKDSTFQEEDLVKTATQPKDVVIEWVNIAGANTPELMKIEFEDTDYDLYSTPFWIDRGIIEIRELISLIIETTIVKKQISILEREFQVTTQRVNLFEKVKIPESLENIRRIRIYLGDQQANAVGISKVAKKKVEIRNQEVLFA